MRPLRPGVPDESPALHARHSLWVNLPSCGASQPRGGSRPWRRRPFVEAKLRVDRPVGRFDSNHGTWMKRCKTLEPHASARAQECDSGSEISQRWKLLAEIEKAQTEMWRTAKFSGRMRGAAAPAERIHAPKLDGDETTVREEHNFQPAAGTASMAQSAVRAVARAVGPAMRRWRAFWAVDHAASAFRTDDEQQEWLDRARDSNEKARRKVAADYARNNILPRISIDFQGGGVRAHLRPAEGRGGL